MAPYRFPKLLSVEIFILEWVRQLLHVEEVYIKKKAHKKNHIVYPTAMGGYAFINNKEDKQVVWILERMKSPLYRAWKYDPSVATTYPH